ncbi:MAG: rRNA maturation RNase YbeY [Longimicrobiales bacterium]
MAIGVAVQVSDELTALLHTQSRRVPATAAARNAARATCRIVGVTDAELSITWLDDAAIAGLNYQYLGHVGPTDVISFELYEHDEIPVGDVYIGFEEAERQAAAHGCTLEEELVRLAVHGTLHILGFDHPGSTGRTESEMWMLQEAIVAEVLA